MGKFFFFSRKFYTSETGIVVKASDNVQPDSLAAAADQIDHMLGKTENGIAARMAEYGASMALYGPDENAYFIPEHRSAWDPDLYNSRRALGMWPNTYAISNADEFFATMCTIWFSVMEESPDWTDGVRGPVNTREDLLKYDPETYAFFDKIFPEDFLDDPWDPSTIPDNYDDVFVPSETGDSTHNYETDTFKILYDGEDGTEYHLEQYNGVVLWWNYGDETINSWKLTLTEEGFHITTLDGAQALAPVNGSTVALTEADITDPEQLEDHPGRRGILPYLTPGKPGYASGSSEQRHVRRNKSYACNRERRGSDAALVSGRCRRIRTLYQQSLRTGYWHRK